MVLLTMTPSIVEALENVQRLERLPDGKTTVEDGIGTETSDRISLSNPKAGNPISHSHVIELSRQLKEKGLLSYDLEVLLRGSRVYVAPPAAKPEPTPEYKALMQRLRREEESRSYERMINSPPARESFSQRFPATSAAYAFSSSHQPINAADIDDDDVTYADIDRQMAVIINVVVSVVACAAAIWTAARWWSTPLRLALSMSGSILVGVAEVVVYSGYIRRVGEAKVKAKGLKEVKKVVQTWTVGGGEDVKGTQTFEEPVKIEATEDLNSSKVRKRKKAI